MNPPEVKLVQTEADFDSLGWHDNYVRAIQFRDRPDSCGDLSLDIDHILEWVEIGNAFHLWVSPASLVFHDVCDLNIEIDWGDSVLELVIDEIRREPSDSEGCSWFTIETNWPHPGGKIRFLSKGFTQTIRRQPVLTSNSKLDPSQRYASDEAD